MTGDDEGFEAFYAATSTRVTYCLYAMTANLDDARDVTQEAYARAWQRWASVRQYEDPEGWVRTVARRIAVSRWRKARNATRALVTRGADPDVAPPGVDHVVLVEALRRIPEAQRHAIVLHHLVGMTVEAVAAELGCASGTIKARLVRGRAALAAILGDDTLEVTR